MKKWLLTAIAVLCIGTCAVGFAACGESGDTEPEHHFSEAWTWDSTNHWHACTDEGCTQRSGTAPHIYGEDDECDICHYTRPPVHEHTWAAKYDESKHWQESTCTDHEPVIEGEAQHSYNNAGECTCGVKQSEAQVYAVYKSFTESKDETVLDFPAWLAYLEENDIESVSLNSAGDGVLHYADNTDEVAYFRTRTVKVQATNAGSPFISYWVKITVTEGSGAPQVLDLQKPQPDELDVTLTFTPVGYSDADLVYHIAIADENDDLPQGEVPYYEDYVVFGDSSVEYAVTEILSEDEFAAEFDFREALAPGHDVIITDPGASIDGSAIQVTPFKNVTAGTYKLTFKKNAQSSFDSWLVDDEKTFRISVVANTTVAVGGNQALYNVYLQKFNISADGNTAYTYLHLPQSLLDENVMLRMSTTKGKITFTMSLEKFEPVVEADGEPVEVATLPEQHLINFADKECGIDISHLEPGTYFASIARCAGTTTYHVSTLPTMLSAAIDDEPALNINVGWNTFYLDITEDSHYLYLYNNSGNRADGSPSIGMLTLHKVKDLDEEAVSFVNGEAYYKLPLEDGTNNYLISLTSSAANLGGLSVSQATRYYYTSSTPTRGVKTEPIFSLNRNGSYNHASALFEATKSSTQDCIYLYLRANGDISDLHIKAEKYDAASSGTLSKENTSFTFSANTLAATYTYTPSAADNFIFSVQSDKDISGITVLKDGEEFVEDSDVSTNGIFRMIECEAETPVTFTFLHRGADYPTVRITVSAPSEVSGGNTLADNEEKSITLNSGNSVMVYSFTPSAEGLHILDIVGENANTLTVYKGTEVVISPSETASSYVYKFDTALESETPYTYVILYGGTDEVSLTVTMHSAKTAPALTADTDTDPALGATAHVKYYTYTPAAKGDNWLEVIGENVKDYAVYDAATGNAVIAKVADSAKSASGLWFTQSNETYSAKNIVLVYYGDAEESVTLKLHTAGAAATGTAGTAFDVTYTAEATSWHVQYVKLTATAGTYLLTIAANGGTLANLSVYEEGNTTALKSFAAGSVAAADVTEFTVTEGSVLVFVYGGADALTVSAALIAKNTLADALTLTADPETAVTFGTDPASRVKFYTFTPDTNRSYQVEFTTDAEATLARLAVYVYEGDAEAATTKTAAKPEDKALSQALGYDGFEAKASTKYTICIVWTGEGALEGKAGIAVKLAAPTDAKHQNDVDYGFGQNYIIWSDVEGATNYIVQKSNGDTVATYDAATGKGIYEYFAYEAAETGTYKVIAQYKSGDGVMAQSEKSVSIDHVTTGKLILKITTPAAWEEHTITVRFQRNTKKTSSSSSSTANPAGSWDRKLTLPAGAHEYTLTFYPRYGSTYTSTSTNLYSITTVDSTIDGWGYVYSGETSKVPLVSGEPITTNLDLKQKVAYTVTVKAPQGYVNSNVKVSFMNGGTTYGSTATVSFDGTGEGEQTQTVTAELVIRKYTIAVDFGNGIDQLEEEATIEPVGDATTAEATIVIKKRVEHKVTVNLPEDYESETQLTVGLFKNGTEAENLTADKALLTKTVTPQKGAETAVTFEATWGVEYIGVVLSGLSEQYVAKPSAVMKADSAETTGSATISVELKPKLIIIFKHDAVVTSGSIKVMIFNGKNVIDKTQDITEVGATETRIEVYLDPDTNYIMVESCTIDGATYTDSNVMSSYTITEGQKEVTVTITLTKSA